MEGATAPARSVENNVLTSSDLPRIKLRIDPRLRFVGRLQFVLYDVAEADLFVFVEADDTGKISRRIIVQFEGYLDNNSYTYNYGSPTTVKVGTHEFLQDYYATDREHVTKPVRPDSDSARVSKLLGANGYTEPVRSVRARLVRLLGAERRKELLLIYGESLDEKPNAAERLPSNDFLGEEHAHWVSELLERALQAIEVIED
jgi:hypothetical protein